MDVRVLSVSNQSRLRAVFLRAFEVAIDCINNSTRRYRGLSLIKAGV